MDDTDANGIAEIYNYYILNSIFTFEVEPVNGEEIIRRRMKFKPLPWYVYETDGIVVAYAYASDWKKRKAYKHSVEISIYTDTKYTGKGIGKKLYSILLNALEDLSKNRVIAGVALPNDQSVRFHENLGFRKVAHFESVGFKFGQWIDVAYYQKHI